MFQSAIRVIGNYYYRYGKKTALKLFTALVIAAMLLPNATPAFAAAYDATKEALQRANPQPAEMESVNWPDTTHSAAQRAPGVESLGIPKPTATPLPGTAIAPQATPVDGSAPESRLLYNPTLNMAETTSEAETSSAAKPPTKRVITDPIALQFLQRVPLAESTFNLTARYPAIYAGHNTSIFYELPTWESLEAGLGKDDTLVLAIQVPEGFSPLIYIYSTWDHENRILYVTPDKARGILRFSVAKDTQGPWTFQGALVLNETELDTSELTLEEKGVFSIDAAGGNATHDDLGITVEFSEKALPEGLELRIRPVFAWADAYASSPSGNPFEILAEGLTSDSAVTTFPDYFTITLVYDEGWLWGDEKDLVMKYYNDETGRWVALPSVVDTETNTLTAWTNHLTEFDYGIDNYQAASLPTLDPFQVSQFTGAGTYSFPIEVPAGPGGLQPSLSLSYNSQIVNSANYANQASWVGMGWSMDTGYIERTSIGDDPMDIDDDEATLTMNGVGGLLKYDSSSGYYHTEDESFWALDYDVNNDEWTAWDKQGNEYHFESQADMVVYDKNYSPPWSCDDIDVEVLTWRWYLTKVTNIHDEILKYTYTTEIKTREDRCGNNSRTMHTAVYPEYIYYPGYVSGTPATYTYRIHFPLNTGDTDYDDEDWPDATSPVHYRTKHLDKIQIQQYVDSTWTTIRYYDFTFASTSGHVYPNYVWPAGGKTITLTSIKEYADDGASGWDSLPATTFTYGDDIHLTQGDNGYGGKVVFVYDAWNEVTPSVSQGYWLLDYHDSDDDCGGSPPNHGWTAYDGGDTVDCDSYNLIVDGQAWKQVFEAGVTLGSVYKFQVRIKSYNGGDSAYVGFDYGGGEVTLDEITTTSTWQVVSGYVTFPGDASDARLYIDCNGCRIEDYDIARLTTKYRVTEKKVYPNNDTTYSSFTYIYDDAGTDLTGAQFLGHNSVVAKGPEGAVTTTYFYQDDDLKGREGFTVTNTQDLFEDFDSKDTGVWTFGSGTTAERVGGDEALEVASSGTTYRTTNAVSDDEVAFFHLYAPWEEGIFTAPQGRVVLATSTYSIGVALVGGATTCSLKEYYNGTTGSTLISTTDCDYNTWYVVMIVVDDDDDFLVRVWQADAPGIYGEFTRDMTNSLNWRGEIVNSAGRFYVDSYREGTLYSHGRTVYATSNPHTDTTWVRPDTVYTRNYEADASWTGTRVEYEYNTSDQGGGDASTQFGNQTRVIQAYWDDITSAWVEYRATKTEYYPNEDLTNGTYLVGYPARTIQFKCPGGTCDFGSGDELAETLHIYDSNSTYSSQPTVGILASVRTWVDNNGSGGAARYSQVTFAYDTYGNQTSVTTYSGYGTASAAPSTGSRATTTTYDSTYQTYPTAIQDPLGNSTSLAYDYALGVPTSVTDPNSVSTSAEYDSFGRLVKIVAPGDSSANPTMQVTFNDVNPTGTVYPFTIDLRQRVDASNTYRIMKFYNGAGQLLQIQTVGVVTDDGTKNVVVDYDYDDLGRVVKQSVPYASAYTASPSLITPNWTTNPYTATSYDALGRASSVTATNDVAVTYAYDDLETSVTEITAIGTPNTTRTTTTTYDIWGRVSKVTPPSGPDLRYTYDELDRLTNVKKGNDSNFETTLTYDNAGRKTDMDDPDMGAWEYTYDALGNLTLQEDAKGQRICLYYDDNNRLAGKHYRANDSCPSSPTLGDLDVAYMYDSTLDSNYGIGRMTAMYDPSGYTTWLYDSRGRVMEEQKYIAGEGVYSTSYSYNSGDLPTSVTYPTGEVVDFTYHPQIALDSVSTTSPSSYTYIASTDYDATGRIVERVYGDALSDTHPIEVAYSYYAWDTSESGDSLGRLQTITAGPDTDPDQFQDVEYEYDLVGNVTEIYDRRDTDNLYETQTFTYDTIDRLATAASSSDDSEGDYSGTYSYDSQGRLSSKGGTSLSYTDSTRPHAADSFGSDSYTYDANGNMTARPWDGGTQTLTYDYENRVVGFSGDAPYTAATTFWDGFESGDLTGWDSSVTDSGDLSVNTSCSIEGGDCLAALIDDNTAIFVQDNTPSDESDWHARFLFDPNTLTMTSGDYHDIYQMRDGGTTAVKLQLRYNSGNYQIKLRVNNDAGSGSTLGWYTITDDVHEIVIEWWQDDDAGADSGSNTGKARLYIDGTLKNTLVGIDNDTHQIDNARLGALQGMDAGTSGTMYFDGYTSWSEAEGMVYDGNGVRVKSVVDDGTTVYVGGIYEKDVTNSTTTTYYNGTVLKSGSDVYWLLSDHLGSISILIDTDTTYSVQYERRYEAWGEERYDSGTNKTTLGYTGQREEEDVGLYFYKARWYLPEIGRFVQADTIVPEPWNNLAYDRYAYVYNNPINKTDPSGHCALDDADCWWWLNKIEDEFGITILEPFNEFWNIESLALLYGAIIDFVDFFGEDVFDKYLSGISLRVGTSDNVEGSWHRDENVIEFSPSIFEDQGDMPGSLNFTATVIHEFTHALVDITGGESTYEDFEESVGWGRRTCLLIFKCWVKPNNGPTNYANDNSHDDLAESVTALIISGYATDDVTEDRINWINNWVSDLNEGTQ